MRRPNFIGIGAMKSATTWAWHQLNSHPQIQMPMPKEHHYFDTLNVTPQQYLTRFGRVDPKCVTGEITPAYLTIPHAPLLARSIAPKAKIIAILRNPVDRAFSHWKVAMWSENKIPLGTTFRQAFDHGHPHQGADWHSIREKGRYVKYLKRWYNAFPEGAVGVFWYDDLLEDPIKFARSLYRFLGVDDEFVPPNWDKKYNSNWSGRKVVLKDEDRKHILNFYMPSIERLESFTGRDLSKWKQ